MDPTEAVAASPDLMTSILVVVGALITIGIVIAGWTKTDKDDKIMARILGVFRSVKK